MERVGLLNGVFDLFHIGHLNVIGNARKNCDHLIVGVLSDELVEVYKGKRAIIPFEERIRIVEAIKGVDEVIRVDTLDKEVIWMSKPFNILFSGDDRKGTPLWNETERVMRAHGVTTIFFPYTQLRTSTKIRETIYKANNGS